MRINSNRAGFTLLELIVVITITALLSMGGLAAYIQYSQRLALNNATSDILSIMQLAKSKAQSQVKPESGLCATDILQGYKVTIDPANNSYGLQAVCGNNNTEQSISQWQKALSNDTCFTCKTSNSFLFRSLTGNVEFDNPSDTTATIKVNAYGAEKTVSISKDGVFQLAGACPESARISCSQTHQVPAEGTVSLPTATPTITLTPTPTTAPEPHMVSPVPGSTIGSTTTFTWSAGEKTVTQWWLYIGTTDKGSSNLLNESQGTNLSKTVSGLPTSGAVYVRLWWLTDSWKSDDYQYTATPNDTTALLAPTNVTASGVNSSGDSLSVTISWNSSPDATLYSIYTCDLNGCTPDSFLANVTATSYNDVLGCGIARIYGIKARNNSEGISPLSNFTSQMVSPVCPNNNNE